MSLPSRASCVLCGAKISRPRVLPEWMREFRAVYTEHYLWHKARLSGVGERRTVIYVIPFDDTIEADMTDFLISKSHNPLAEIEPMKSCFGNVDGTQPEVGVVPSDDDSPIWGYTFHSGCWDILSAAYSSSRPREGIDVQALFDLCRSQPIQSGVMIWGHDYGGLLGFRERPDMFFGEEPWLSGSFLKDIYVFNPGDISELATVVETIDETQVYPSKFCDETAVPRTGASIDPLASFPAEIVADIFVYLDTHDVRNFRLASRTAASLQLPSRFWKSRFSLGGEFSWVHEAKMHPKSTKAWKALYLGIKSLPDTQSIRNRKRVWELAHVICHLVDQRLASPTCYGRLCPTSMELEGTKDNLSWNTASSSTKPSALLFLGGSRPLFERRVAIPKASFKVFVSFAYINHAIYVSGIRLISQDQPVIILGYTRPENEMQLIWNTDKQEAISITGFIVAGDEKGIRGLAALDTEGIPSRWVGDHYQVSKKRLTALAFEPTHALKPITHLKGEFDALKLVSLSVTDGSQYDRMNEFQEQPLRDEKFWYPDIPGSHLNLVRTQAIRITSRGYSAPFFVAMFGGEHGQHLPHLNELRFWTLETPRSGSMTTQSRIFGIDFRYSQDIEGQNYLLFGKVPEAQYERDEVRMYQMDIDSSNGERLTQLETLCEARSRSMFGLRLHTNHDRIIEVPSSSTALLQDHDFIAECLIPSQASIVGIFATLGSRTGVQSLGFVSNKVVS